MKTVTILRGLPASGKSTYAKQIVKDNPGNYKRINRDDLRDMLDSYQFSKSNEKFVRQTRDWLIQQALRDGKHVIVDDTNLSETNIKRITQLVKEVEEELGHQIKISIKEFDIDLEEAIKRDAKREKPVGEDVIKRMHKQFYGKRNQKLEYALQNQELPKAIICDLDGTLAIINNRSPFDGSKCENDLPNTPVINLVKAYKKLGFKILLLSGRQGQYKEQTINWLNKYEVEYDALWMRAEKDSRKDAIIKKELYNDNIKDHYNIEFVLDDRNQVVDLWRLDLKLPCFQVFYGDF